MRWTRSIRWINALLLGSALGMILMVSTQNLLMIVVAASRSHTRLGPRQIFDALADGGYTCAYVALAVAAAAWTRTVAQATTLAAVTPVPDTLGEYQFAGLLRGARTGVAKCIGSDLQVPASAEIRFF